MIEYYVHILKQYIPNFDSSSLVIFDIGSRDCKQSLEFASYFPNSSIYAFECNPTTLSICRSNIENTKQITLIDKAVNIYDGRCKFFPINSEKTITTWSDGNPGASSLFKANGQYDIETYVQDEIEVDCTRIDTIMKKNNINHVDIIWMDLQGAELLALESFGELINNVKFIHTEVSFKPMYEGQVLFSEIHDFLLNRGFTNITPIERKGWQSDIIYMRKQKTNIL